MNLGIRVQHVGTPDGATIEHFGLLPGMLAIVFAVGCGGSTNSVTPPPRSPVAASISGTINVGTAPIAIAIDSASNKIYVADYGMKESVSGSAACTATGADVMTIDGATGSTSAASLFSIFQLNPVAAALNPASHTFYVVALQYGKPLSSRPGCTQWPAGLEVIDTGTLSQTADHVMFAASGIDVNPMTGILYVTRRGVGTIASATIAMDGGGNLKATIPVGANPLGVAVNATTNKIYVANNGDNNISVIDGASNSVVATITDPNAVSPVVIAVNPTTNTVYVANQQSNNVTEIDGASNSVTTTIGVGTSPSGVAVDPATNFIYVANAGNSQSGDPGNISVIDGAKHTTTTLIDAKAVGPSAVAVNSVANKIYVANSGSNNVTVIDGAHN
jgi:YVTN family beta-propeller protein